MKIFTFQIIFSLVFSYRKIQYEGGSQILISGTTGHILESTSTLPRYIELDVQFQSPFSVDPQVFLSQTSLDINRTYPLGFIEKVRQVTIAGFKIRANAVSQYALHGLTVDWYAFDDSRVQVLTYESSNLEELSTNTGERKIYFTIQHNLKQASNGVVSLIGIKHKQDDPKVELNIEQITSSDVIISVRTDSLSQIDYIKFNVLLGTDQSLWTSSAQALIVDPASNDQLIYAKRINYYYPYYQELSISFPLEWYSSISVPMFIMRGYHNSKFENIRLNITKGIFQSNKVVASVGTQNPFINPIRINIRKKLQNYSIIIIQKGWNSTLYGVYYYGAVYYPDPNYRIFDPNCAELFSECNYQGDSLIICDRIPDLSGYFKPIKSLSIPPYRKLQLFDQDNYQGNKILIVENQNCISFNDKLSAKFQPVISFIKIFFLDTDLNPTCFTATFYSECNYQGIQYTVNRGQNLKLSNQIPFQIKSIKLCRNMVVRLRDSKFLNGITQEYVASQTCLNNYQFPKYRPA